MRDDTHEPRVHEGVDGPPVVRLAQAPAGPARAAGTAAVRRCRVRALPLPQEVRS